MKSVKNRPYKNDLVRHTYLVLGVIGVGWLFWTGYDIGLQAERKQLIAAIWRHVGYGVVMSPFLAAYVWFRLTRFRREKSGRFSNVVLMVLSACLMFLLVSGPIVVWTYGSDLKVFSWFVLPNPIGELPAIHDPLEYAHAVVAKAIPILLALDFRAHLNNRH